VSRASIAAAALVAALALAGCGGGDDSGSSQVTPTTEWADGFCTAVTTWKDDLTGITDRFTSLSSFSEENLRAAADDAKSATDQFLDDLNNLGRPDTQSGQEVEDSIDSLSTTLQTELDSIETTVDETSGITELPDAVKDITASLSAMSTAFSSTLSTIEDADAQGELKDALESSPSCDELTS
jgi:hypothetical protein